MNMDIVMNVVILLLFISGTKGSYLAICGKHGTCVPRRQCLKPFTGQCNNVWCCKQAEYKIKPPPAGECICVSELKNCGGDGNPYNHVNLEADCECCDCKNYCMPLLPNGLCPNYEKDRGVCDVERHYCCKENSDKECKCFEECPESWSLVGSCKICCLPCTTGGTNVTNDQSCEETNAGVEIGFYSGFLVFVTMTVLFMRTKAMIP